MDDIDSFWHLIALILIGMVAILIVVRVSMFLQWFKKELRYVQKEIDRTTGSEQQHWIKRKKRLLRSLIPFVPY